MQFSTSFFPPLNEALATGLAQMQLELSPATQQKLLAYVQLLAQWNQAYNLTAVRDPQQMVAKHLLDSLSILPWITVPEKLLDIGSGAGLPGIPLAIALPELQVTLIDSATKRCRFQRQAQMELELANVSVVQQRVENWQPEQPYNFLVSRAFASVGEMLHQSGHLLAEGGWIFAMKGTCQPEELAQIQPPFELTSIETLIVPDVEGERHLLRIRRGTTA